MDVFHVSINTSRSLLLEDIAADTLQMEDIWDEEDISVSTRGLLSVFTLQQKASFVAHHELSRICTFRTLDVLNLKHR